MSITRRISWGLVDQIVSSASNLLFVVAIARSSSPDQFGSFSITYTLLTFTIALQRSSLGVHVSIASKHLRPPMEIPFAAGFGICAFGLIAGGVFPGSVTTTAVVTFAAAPAVLVQDLLRYAAIADGDPKRALWSDSIWLGITALALPAAGYLGSAGAAIMWCAGAIVAALMLSRHDLLRIRHPGWLSSEGRLLAPALVDAFLATCAPLIVAMVLAYQLSLADVAGYRGASSLFAPISLLLSAAPLVLLPEQRRLELSQAKRLALFQSFTTATAVVVWTALLLVAPRRLGIEVLGGSWDLARHVLPVISVEMAFFSLASGAEALLRLSRSWITMLRTRVVYLAVLFATLAPLVTHGVRVGLWALVVSASLRCLLLGISASRLPAARYLTTDKGAPDGGSPG